MAEYIVEWTEHRKMRARIEAPPNDERMLDAAQETVLDRFRYKPLIVSWAERDRQAAPVEDDKYNQAVTYDVTLVGKVEIIHHPARKGKPALSEERVQPL